MNRRGFFGWLRGILCGLLDGKPSDMVVLDHLYRLIKPGTNGLIFSDHAAEECKWEDQRPGDVILSVKKENGVITHLNLWRINEAPSRPSGLIWCDPMLSFGPNTMVGGG